MRDRSPLSSTETAIHRACRLALIAAMVVVPATRLPIAYRTRAVAQLGWQMYAHDHALPTYWAVDATGASRVVVPRIVAPGLWGGFGYPEAVVRKVCGEAPGTVRVIATKDYIPGFREVYSCP